MKLMLIGGGETGRPGRIYSMKEIDEEVVKMTGKENPNFLFVGYASNSSESYFDTMKKIYKELNCECFNLKKKNVLNNRELALQKIKNADIIYFCGGDTIKLIETVKELDLVDEIKNALESNKVIAGISAGAILFAKEGYSDSLKMRGESDKYDFIKGLGLIDMIFSPHETEEKYNEMITEIGERKVYSLENNTALKIIDNKYEVIKSDMSANAYLVTKDKKEILTSGTI